MKTVLSLKCQRQLAIIELLFHNEWLTYQEISKQLNIPIKTLKSDILELKILFDAIKIDTSKKYGIKLTIEPSFCKVNIYQKFLTNSLEFQIIETIFFQQFSSIVELSESLYISVSTVKRMVKRINTALLAEEFQISLKHMQLIGNPLSICNFIKRYFEEKYCVAERILSDAQISVLDQMITAVFIEHKPLAIDFPCDFATQNSLRIYGYTLIHLVKNNSKALSSSIKAKEFHLLNQNKALCEEFYSQFLFDLKHDLFLKALTLLLERRTETSLEKIEEEIRQSNEARTKYEAILSILTNLEEKNNCLCKHKKDILLRIYNLEKQIIGRNYILHNKQKEFFLGLHQTYGQPVQEILAMFDELFPPSAYKKYILYEAFFILFTIWSDLSDVIHRSVPSLKAGLLFDVEKEFIDSLGKKIEYYLNHRFKCTTLQITSLNQIKKVSKEFDCIITNIPDIPVSKALVVVNSLILDTDDFNKLLLIYEDYYRCV